MKHEDPERWVSNQTEEVVKLKESLVTENKDQTIVVSNSDREHPREEGGEKSHETPDLTGDARCGC